MQILSIENIMTRQTGSTLKGGASLAGIQSP